MSKIAALFVEPKEVYSGPNVDPWDKARDARAIKTGACQRLSKNQRAATPLPFRDLLLSIAGTARVPAPAMQPAAEFIRAAEGGLICGG